jgi:hypothetical protein
VGKRQISFSSQALYSGLSGTEPIPFSVSFPMFIKLELSLFVHSSNDLCYNSKKDVNISLGKGTQQLQHESNHSQSSRSEAKNV